MRSENSEIAQVILAVIVMALMGFWISAEREVASIGAQFQKQQDSLQLAYDSVSGLVTDLSEKLIHSQVIIDQLNNREDSLSGELTKAIRPDVNPDSLRLEVLEFLNIRQ